MRNTAAKHPETRVAKLFIAMSVILAVLGFVVSDSAFENAVPLVLISFALLGSIVAYVYAIGSRGLRYGRFFFYFYVVFGFLFPGWAQIAANTFYLGNQTYRGSDLTMAVVIVIFGLVAFETGYTAFSRKADANPARSDATGLYRISLRTIMIALSLVVLVGAYRIAALGPGSLFSTRFAAFESARTLGYDTGAATGLTILLSRQAAIVFLFMAFLYFLRRNKGGGQSIIAAAVLLAAVCVNAVFNFPVNVPRSVLAGIILGMTIIWFNTTRRASNWILFVTPALLYGLAPLLASYNRGLRVSAVGETTSVQKYLLTGDFDGFQQLVNGVIYVAEHGLSWGHQLISSLLFFVPRSLWTSKADSTGVLLAHAQGYLNSNLSAPIFLEFYIDFGFIGVVIGLGLIGVLLRRIDRLFERSNVPDGSLLAATTLCAFLPPILRGALLGVLPVAAFAILLPLFLQIIDRRRLISRPLRNGRLPQRKLPARYGSIDIESQN